MDAKQFASKLNDRSYGDELNQGEAQAAKEFDLVIVFGYSDDNMEFRGAINDEVSCYDGGVAYLTQDGLLQNDCDSEYCPYYEKAKQSAQTIEALWDVDGYSWKYKTNIPHETFEITEDNEPYCKGIVFSLSDIQPN